MKKREKRSVVGIGVLALLLFSPISAHADPDAHACEVLQRSAKDFHDLDVKRAAAQNKAKQNMHKQAIPGDGTVDKWRDQQRELGQIFRDTQVLLESTATEVGHEEVEEALHDQALGFEKLASIEEEMVSSDESQGTPDELTERFSEAVSTITPAAARLNALQKDVCASQ